MSQLVVEKIKEHNDDLIGLILDVKRGNNESFKKLALKYSPVIKNIASRFYLIGGEWDDLYQEGLIGLYKAIQVFDPIKGNNFNSLARLCIKRNIMQIVRTNRSRKHMIHSNSYLLYDLTIDDKPLIHMIADSDRYNPENAVIKNENYQEMCEIINHTLTKFEKQVFHLFLSEKAYSEISNELGTTKKSVDNALTRVKKKLRNKLKSKII